jgi:FMN reductase
MTYPIEITDNSEISGEATITLLAVDGSPSGGGRTRTAVEAVAGGAERLGGIVEAIGLAEHGGLERVLEALDGVDAVVFGAPVYRAAAAAPLKQLLDLIPRGSSHDSISHNNGERLSPLAGKPVAIVQTGASLHHFLALDALRNVLAGFFAAHVVAPGLYVPRDGFGEYGLLEPYAAHARSQGEALAELTHAVKSGAALASVRPQA